jgi:hypothetical protein
MWKIEPVSEGGWGRYLVGSHHPIWENLKPALS